MKHDVDSRRFDGVWTGDPFPSVFYRGRQQTHKTNSFRPTTETQAMLDRERYRTERRKRNGK